MHSKYKANSFQKGLILVKSKHKTALITKHFKFKNISFKFVMVSKFNIHTVHLKCFGSIMYPLNEHKTWTKNCNQG